LVIWPRSMPPPGRPPAAEQGPARPATSGGGTCRVLREFQVAADSGEVPQVHRGSVDDGDYGIAAPPAWAPDDALIRRALVGWAFNTGRQTTGTPSTEIAEALAWVSSAFPRVIAA
jgi:hypothetical protein